MSAPSFIQTMRSTEFNDANDWLVFADWFADRGVSDAESYGRDRANLLMRSKSDRPRMRIPRILNECSDALLWLWWEAGTPEDRTVLFAHHCFLHGEIELLKGWLDEMGPHDE